MLFAAWLALATSAEPARERYPYGGPRFSGFVSESYNYTRAAKATRFYEWLASAYDSSNVRYAASPKMSLHDYFAVAGRERKHLKSKSSQSAWEIKTSAFLHKMVKGTIPKFSLDRGFEFAYAVQFGERQCFLQSVLIAGMLQRMGVDAGVVMVFRNIKGEYSNNGHAVVLVKLSDGRDIIVDASDPEPFAKQQGLFVEAGGYRYVAPVYAPNSAAITGYRTADASRRLDTRQVRTLDRDFLRSQFFYYRGERAKGGLVLTPQTASGLAEAGRSLRKSVELCPRNPLAVYMLGRVYLAQGDILRARAILLVSQGLYQRSGWVPSGQRDFLAAAK